MTQTKPKGIKRVKGNVAVSNEAMPLKLENEGKSFVVTMAVSRKRLLDLLRKDTVSQGVIGVRRIEDRDLDALELSREQDEDQDSDRWNE
jgi:hypothetical protein